MSLKVFVVVTIISTFSTLVPVVIFLAKKKFRAPDTKYVALLLFFSWLSDLYGMLNYLVLRFPQVYTTDAVNAYHFLETIFIILFYKELLPKHWGKWLLLTMILVLVSGIFFVYKFHSSTVPVAEFSIIIWLVVITLSIAYFYRLMMDLPTGDLRQLPVFWINTAFLIYYSSSLIIYIFRDHLIASSPETLTMFWMFHNIDWLIHNVLVTIGLWKVKAVRT